MERNFKNYGNFTIIFDFVAQQIFFYPKRQKKKTFLHKSRQIGHFSEGEAPQLIQKWSKIQNFFFWSFLQLWRWEKSNMDFISLKLFAPHQERPKKKTFLHISHRGYCACRIVILMSLWSLSFWYNFGSCQMVSDIVSSCF